MEDILTEPDRSINKLYNFNTRNVKSAVKLLNTWVRSQAIVRRKIEEQIQAGNSKYGCAHCGQIVKLARHKPNSYSKPVYYFKHLNDSNDCITKKNTKLTESQVRQQKYNGAKESKKHIDIKNHIHINLASDKRFSDTVQEKYIKSRKGWFYGRRKPDVSTNFFGFQIAFEVQVSTEFLSVVTAREMFYEEELKSILWVFSDFDPNDHEKRKTMHDDIISMNHMNALSVSKNSKKLTKEHGQLVFDGHYCVPEYDYEKQEISQKWFLKSVKFEDLLFDIKTKKPYFSHYESLLKIENQKKKAHKAEIKRKHREEAEKAQMEKERKEKILCINEIERYIFSESNAIPQHIEIDRLKTDVKSAFSIEIDEWFLDFDYALRAAFSIRDRKVRVRNQDGNWRWLINDIFFNKRAKYYLPLARGIKKQELLYDIFDKSDFTNNKECGAVILGKPHLSKVAKKHLEVIDNIKSGKLKTDKKANLLLEIIATDHFK